VISFNAEHNVWVLWHDADVEVVAPVKTLWPADYGGWVIVAAVVQKGLEHLELAPHANIQSNANWAFRTTDGTLTDLEEGRQQRRVHIHIFGRQTQDPSWGDPIQLAPYREYAAMQDSADVWNETTLNQFSAFLADEIPRALKRSQAG
jgi:hypothetical protein